MVDFLARLALTPGLSLGLSLGPAPAPSAASAEVKAAGEPEGPSVERDAGDAAASVGALSSGGTDRGALELGLGSAALAIGVGLIVAGSFDLASGLERRRRCAVPEDEVCFLDPPGLIFASTGLAYAFSIPALIGGGLLLRRGVRIHRDYRAVRAMAAASRLRIGFASRGARGFAVDLRLRF